jgi:diguanylate cyclase (GGDEF)-like protein
VGDQLLQEVSGRLHSIVRRQDQVFRISGDEFVIVLATGVDREPTEMFAHRVMQAIRKPCVLGAVTAHVTASVGVAHYPDNGRDARSLLLAADGSMYRAKQSGKDGFFVAGKDAGAEPLLA